MAKLSSKAEALRELEAVLAEFGLAESTVSREHFGSPSFIARLRDPDTDITTRTLDKVWAYVLKVRGQTELDTRPAQKRERK
jgi:hypothetical protein